jgi:AGZA family xanthine/uracil permease-like MFS transporter
MPVFLSLCGLFISGTLLAKNVKGAMLWGILVTALIGVVLGMIKFKGVVSMPPSMAPTFLQMDIAGAMKLGLISVIFIFLFMDVFDTVGTLAGVGELGGFLHAGKMPRVGKAMFTDAVGTCVGAACGTPTVTCYIESAAGIASGGRSGLTAVVTGFLFLAALFFSPLIRMIGGGTLNDKGILLHPVTAPALIIVGSMMVHSIMKVDWRDHTESIPAFLTVIMMPLTFSIASGIAVGLISYAGLKILTGRKKEVSWLINILALLFILRFVYVQSLLK